MYEIHLKTDDSIKIGVVRVSIGCIENIYWIWIWSSTVGWRLLSKEGNDETPKENDFDDQLDNNGNGFAAPTDFDVNALETQGSNPQVLKEQQIFVTALLQV